MIKRLWPLLYAALLPCGSLATTSFRMHLLSEPQTLDPQTTSSASGNYLFHNIYRGLYVYDGQLKPEGAKSCKREARRLRCVLKPMRWSDGSPVTAGQYVNSFRRLIDSSNKSPQADVLFTLKN